VGRWLVQKTEESGKRVLQHKITARSTVVSYGPWAGIFWQFFPKDVFASEKSRSRLLRVLVKEVFGGYRDSKGEAHDELAITRHIQSGLGIDTGMEWERADSSTLNHSVVMGVLQHLFSYLLHMHVVLVYVSGVELADEDSLTLLLLLLLLLRSPAPMRSAIVLSGTSSEEANSTRLDSVSGKGFLNRRDSLIEGWHGKARALCVALPQTQLLHLTFYSAADITPILAVALGSHASDISPALATAVHTVTGGSLLWIQEVVHFLKDRGEGAFNSAVSAKRNTNPEAGAGGPNSGLFSSHRFFREPQGGVFSPPKAGPFAAWDISAPGLARLTRLRGRLGLRGIGEPKCATAGEPDSVPLRRAASHGEPDPAHREPYRLPLHGGDLDWRAVPKPQGAPVRRPG